MWRQPLQCLATLRAATSALLVVLPAVPLVASTLTVQSANPNTGAYAARVGVASACTADNHTVVTGPIGGGTYEACSSLTSDADLGAGATTFRAGDLVVLGDGFSVATGASLTVEIDRALYPDAWVQDDTPDGETVYSARFYIDSTALVLTAVDRFFHFLAFDGAGDPEVRVGVKFNAGTVEKRLFLETIDDVGGVATTENGLELVLPDGWNWVEVGWAASSGSNDGRAFLCVNANSPPTGCVELVGLDNDTGAIDLVRWGAIDVPSASDFGDLDLDDFESRRSLNIGP